MSKYSTGRIFNEAIFVTRYSRTWVQLFWLVLLFVVPYPQWPLAIILVHLILSTAARNKLAYVFTVHCLTLRGQDIRRLPGPLLPSFFPCIISCRMLYLLLRIITPKYQHFLFLTVLITSLSLYIRWRTAEFVTWNVPIFEAFVDNTTARMLGYVTL